MNKTILIFSILFSPLIMANGHVDKSTVEYVRVDFSGKGIIKFTRKLTNLPSRVW
ncbi:hypothetical protein J8L86_12625 [Shewanella sp. MMG014]|uniref:hypothetical protein n=1 Tax=Shewanella sp. MMG014 TaxID=2822691 RepID=UPI001B38AEE3|nr:hypothetical protein [Shewanella sp. MMG014]MBQ4890697.1 hypothetical protein [Shewanella sp. MMG014]